jgi:hypothetical protein
MKFQFDWSLKDGALDYDTGRIVVFDDYAIHSTGKARDHNDLIKALAAKYRLKQEDVYANAARFYWQPARNGIIISPVRKIDEDWVYNNIPKFKAIIDREFS